MEILELLYQAFHSPLGLRVPTDDPERLRQKLYQVRTQEGSPELATLSFVQSPSNPTGELWIVKRNTDG